MPRFLIERTYTVDVEELATVGTRAAAVGHHFPEVVWEHSHVVLGESGMPRSFVSTPPRTRRCFDTTPAPWAITSSRRSMRSQAT